MQEGKYPEFKMPDIYPAFFNPAKCLNTRNILHTNHLNTHRLHAQVKCKQCDKTLENTALFFWSQYWRKAI